MLFCRSHCNNRRRMHFYCAPVHLYIVTTDGSNSTTTTAWRGERRAGKKCLQWRKGGGAGEWACPSNRKSRFASQILTEKSFPTFCCCLCGAGGKKTQEYVYIFCFLYKCCFLFFFLFLIIESLYLNGHSSRHVFTKATALRVLAATAL